MKAWFDFAPVDCHYPELKEIRVNGIELDSRKVQANDVFFAVPGDEVDGRRFIDSALGKGARVVVFESDSHSFEQRHHSFLIGVPNLKNQLGDWAARFYDDASNKITIIAVTGTNGKTSCTQLIAGALQQLGMRCGVMGTLGNGEYGKLTPSLYTTPDAFVMQSLFSSWLHSGIYYAAIEASSHGLVLGRMQGTHIHTAAITNITRDHLDFHKTMESYVDAKKILFHWPDLKAAVINVDDPLCATINTELDNSVALFSAGENNSAQIQLKNVELLPSGLALLIETSFGEVHLASQLYGRFNAHNLIIALACLLSIGIPFKDAAQALSRVKPVAGRMQKVDAGRINVPDVVVDYAHTPDALEKLLLSAREHCAGQLWCVFGCGGDRDAGKRPEMAAIAEKLADCCIVTNDNPRTESPEAIVNDILRGLQNPSAVDVILDRKMAIEHAIAYAKPGDVVLLAGKGHETYQEVNHVRSAFSDVECAQQALSQYSVKLSGGIR